MRRPNSDITDAVVTPYTPVVSTAIGSNPKRASNAEYFRRFYSSAFRAAYPGATAELFKLVSANVSTHVTSQHRLLPLEKGNTVIPSGPVFTHGFEDRLLMNLYLRFSFSRQQIQYFFVHFQTVTIFI